MKSSIELLGIPWLDRLEGDQFDIGDGCKIKSTAII